MSTLRPGLEIFGTGPNGADIYKDRNGYYFVDINIKTMAEYRKYLPKSWKPDVSRPRIVMSCRSKTRKGKWKGCSWVQKSTRTTRKHA